MKLSLPDYEIINDSIEMKFYNTEEEYYPYLEDRAYKESGILYTLYWLLYLIDIKLNISLKDNKKGIKWI